MIIAIIILVVGVALLASTWFTGIGGLIGIVFIILGIKKIKNRD